MEVSEEEIQESSNPREEIAEKTRIPKKKKKKVNKT